jgi:hypothetical protein
MKVVHILPNSDDYGDHRNTFDRTGFCGRRIYTVREMKTSKEYGTTFDGWCTISLMDDYPVDNPIEFEWCEECLAAPDYHLAALAELP